MPKYVLSVKLHIYVCVCVLGTFVALYRLVFHIACQVELARSEAVLFRFKRSFQAQMSVLRICFVVLFLQYGLTQDYDSPADSTTDSTEDSDNPCAQSAPPSVNCSLARLFRTYGGAVPEINFEGFEHLLEHVHAANFVFNHSLEDHVDNVTKRFVPRHLSHDHQPDRSESKETEKNGDEESKGEEPEMEKCCPCKAGVGENAEEHIQHKHMERKLRKRKRETGETIDVPEPPSPPKAKCYTPGEIMASVKLSTEDAISPENFKELCPVILDQIDRGTCLSNPMPLKKKAKKEHDEEGWKGISFPPLYVWLIALGAVFAISVLGFLIVAVLPLMYSVFYNHLQQFLVAMAVGTLSGDAILHLIPHAFFPHGEEEEGEGESHGDSEWLVIIYGTLILVGILLLYVIEQIINIVPQELEKKRLAKEREKYKEQYSTPPRIYLSASSYYVGEKLGNPHIHENDNEDYDDFAGNTLGRSNLSERHHFCYPFYGSCNDIVLRLHSRSRSNMMGSFSRPVSMAENTSDPEAANINPEAVKFLPHSSGSLDHTPHRSRRSTNPPMKQFTKPEAITSDSGEDQQQSEKEKQMAMTPKNYQRSHSHSAIGDHSHNYHKNESNTTNSGGHGHSHCGHGYSHSGGHLHGHSHSSAKAAPATNETTKKSIAEDGVGGGDEHLHSHGGHGHSHSEEQDGPPLMSHFAMEHETGSHGHGHGHGHAHAADGTCTGTAMMVAFADVFHNFIDGMAIGAAFTSRLAGGLSTSIAVTLHELPHEMGDFALLLQEGLSIKRGLCLNALSSVVCLFGVALGVALGSVPLFNQFIFSLAAGMFLYVSLVTMVSSIKARPDQNPYRHLAYQLLGMLCGIGIMFCIALYEERLQDAIVKVVAAIGLVEDDGKGYNSDHDEKQAEDH